MDTQNPCSPGLLQPQLVELHGVLLSQGDAEVGRRVAFVDQDAICAVEDLVVREAVRLGWYKSALSVDRGKKSLYMKVTGIKLVGSESTAKGMRLIV